jgi:hypothetical protein
MYEVISKGSEFPRDRCFKQVNSVTQGPIYTYGRHLGKSEYGEYSKALKDTLWACLAHDLHMRPEPRVLLKICKSVLKMYESKGEVVMHPEYVAKELHGGVTWVPDVRGAQDPKQARQERREPPVSPLQGGHERQANRVQPVNNVPDHIRAQWRPQGGRGRWLPWDAGKPVGNVPDHIPFQWRPQPQGGRGRQLPWDDDEPGHKVPDHTQAVHGKQLPRVQPVNKVPDHIRAQWKPQGGRGRQLPWDDDEPVRRPPEPRIARQED